jgi:hypothetical protein
LFKHLFVDYCKILENLIFLKQDAYFVLNEDVLTQVKQKNEEEEITTQQEETSIEEDIKKIREILNSVVKDPSTSQKQIAHKLDLVIQELMENLSQNGYQKYLNKLRYRNEIPQTSPQSQMYDQEDIQQEEEEDTIEVPTVQGKPVEIKNEKVGEVKDYGSVN